MINSKKLFFTFLLLLTLLSNSIFSQEIGQIFDKNKADDLFGAVLEKTTINASDLETLLQSTNDKVMFLLENNTYTILGDNRNLLYCNGNFVESNQVFHMYSKTKVLELLNKGVVQTVTLENRSDVFSITAGDYTLELSAPCPPYCAD